MKKKSLLAFAALATLGGAAAAQSSVTVYGKVDLGMVYDAGAAAGKSVRLSNGVTGGSRLGFKGVEDLGGGTKFLFQLESGICIDSAAPVVSNGASVPNFCTGNNAFMGRQAHGDLSGSFGLLTAGRVYSFDFINQTTVDPFGTGLAGDSQNLFGDKSTSRLNNTVQYTTPAVGGLTVSGEVAFGETTGNWEAGRETGGAVTWTSGPAYVSLTILDQDNPNGNGSSRKNVELGATYDFGVVKVHGLVERATGNPTGAARPLDALDILAGVTVPVGNGSVLASYIHHDDRNALTAPGGGDRDAQQVAVGYMYPLSKRTSLYTSFARIQNQHGAVFTVGNATEAGVGNKSFDFGVVHNF